LLARSPTHPARTQQAPILKPAKISPFVKGMMGSLTEGLHTDGPMGKAMLTIMAAFAQLERDTMIERTRAGLAAAAAKGRKGGRPRKVDDADAAKARQLRQKGIAATENVGGLPRQRVPLPHRGRRSLEPAEPQHVESFADVRARVGNNAAGLFVLAGEATPARRRSPVSGRRADGARRPSRG
jgi:hypothetical protein